MGYLRPEHLREDPAGRERLRDVRLRVRVARAQLGDPVARHLLDVAAPTRVAQNAGLYPRRRKVAAATLARLSGIPVRLRARRGTPDAPGYGTGDGGAGGKAQRLPPAPEPPATAGA